MTWIGKKIPKGVNMAVYSCPPVLSVAENKTHLSAVTVKNRDSKTDFRDCLGNRFHTANYVLLISYFLLILCVYDSVYFLFVMFYFVVTSVFSSVSCVFICSVLSFPPQSVSAPQSCHTHLHLFSVLSLPRCVCFSHQPLSVQFLSFTSLTSGFTHFSVIISSACWNKSLSLI